MNNHNSHQTFEPFLANYTQGKNQICFRVMLADTQTAVAAMLKLSKEGSYSCLLESVEGGKVRGRFSVIAIEPDLIWRCKNNLVEINRNPSVDPNDFLSETSQDPLDDLRSILSEGKMENTLPLAPMAAGLFGYFGYEMIRHAEKIPTNNSDELSHYDSIFIRPSIVAIFDRLEDTITLATQIRYDESKPAEVVWENAQKRIKSAEAKLNSVLDIETQRKVSEKELIQSANLSENQYKNMVKTAKEYIKNGDIFQVVLSQRFSIPFSLSPMALYRSLRRLNPSPFLYCFHLKNLGIVGSSPEILVRLRNGEVTIRPIAGTRKRGETAIEDQENAAELLGDIKERAEHLMLLDLGRNDVGRVSASGTVQVVSNFEVEYYSHVMHVASEVRGKIRPEFDAIDALMAGFPAGTVSGAPKIRAMEIIEELEPDKRGIYAGAIGYIGAAGEMDTCIALRTAIIEDNKMHIQAGAGIVYDSDPKSEFEECQNKARALFRAAEDAIKLNKEN